MEKPVPEFAVFQDSKRMRSALWTKESGRWHECGEGEFLAVSVLVSLLRQSKNPTRTMEEIAKVMQGPN
jgi:hypothetical protein